MVETKTAKCPRCGKTHKVKNHPRLENVRIVECVNGCAFMVKDEKIPPVRV